MFRAFSTVAAVVLVLSATSLARASATSRLVYARTPGAAHCPDEQRFRVAVTERLGYDPFRPLAEQTVSVDIFEEKGALRARLTLIDRDGIARGKRELKGAASDCEELLKSLALATSITLDPMAAQMGGVPPSQPEPATRAAESPPATTALLASPPSAHAPAVTTEGASAPDRVSAPDSVTDGYTRTTWSFFGGPLVAVGETPGTAVGGRLGAELRYGHFALAVEARGTLPTSVDSEWGGTAHAGAWGGAIAPCFTAGLFDACGVAYLGRMTTSASDVEVPLETALFTANAGLRGQVAIPIARSVDLRFHLEGMKTLIISQLYLHGSEVWATPPFWGSAGLSAVVPFL
jgi:hypothetical protein